MNRLISRYATQLSTATFVVVGVTGVMMFLGVRNQQVGALHEWLGIAFVVVAILHLVRNWAAFVNMMKLRRSIILVVLLAGGGLAAVGASFATASGGNSLGNPRAAQAEALARLSDTPIATMAPALGLTSQDVIARLVQNGAPGATAEMSLNQVAQKAHKPSYVMYLLIFPQKDKEEH